MNTAPSIPDPLFDFELTVARRADELLQEEGAAGRNALELWCQAERDVLADPPGGRRTPPGRSSDTGVSAQHLSDR